MSESFAAERPAIDQTVAAEPAPYADMREQRDEIEALFLQGYSNREIANKLGGTALCVARNLREVRRRWQRCSQRQELANEVRTAEVYRESVEAWRRSQEPKHAVTTVMETDNGKVTVREQHGPGDCGFLRAAKGALGLLRQFAAEKPAKKARQAAQAIARSLNGQTTPDNSRLHDANELIVALLNVMPPEQVRQIATEHAEAALRAYEDCEPEFADRAKEEAAAEAEAAKDESELAADVPCAAEVEHETPASRPVAVPIEAGIASKRMDREDVPEVADDSDWPPADARLPCEAPPAKVMIRNSERDPRRRRATPQPRVAERALG